MIYVGVLIYVVLLFYKPFLFGLLKLFARLIASNNRRGQIRGKIIDDFTLSDMDGAVYLWSSRALWTGIFAAVLFYGLSVNP